MNLLNAVIVIACLAIVILTLRLLCKPTRQKQATHQGGGAQPTPEPNDRGNEH